jgi:hypothetical protein
VNSFNVPDRVKDGEYVMAKLKSPYCKVREVAAFLRLGSRTLDNMRWRGVGAKYRKHDGQVVYHIPDFIDWSQSNRRPLRR